MSSWGLGLAVFAAFGYTFASIFLKSALEKGVTAAQVNLIANIAVGLVVQPMWLLDDPEVINAAWHFPLISCATFFVGQIFTFAALAKGDVSVATPLLGTKVILVTAINAIVFSVPIDMRWWIAALLGSLAVAVIASGAPSGQAKAVGTTAILSVMAAFFFSLTDTLVQHWAGTTDPMAYLPAMFGSVGILSIIYYAVTDRRAFTIPLRGRRSLVFGAFLLGIQAAAVFLSLAWTHDATVVNLLYSTRSLLSVILAWVGGAALGLKDSEAGTRILLLRLLGAILLFASIALILA